MKHPSLLSKENSVLVIVDVQDRLLHALDQWNIMLIQTMTLIKAANVFHIPMLITEQYPKGLGHTNNDLIELTPSVPRIEKTQFNCFDSDLFCHQLEAIGAKSLVFVGGETHICIMQTALHAIDKGYSVHVVTDAVSSRLAYQKELGLKRIYQAGGILSSVEMVIYEWLERADSQEFKAILPLIK